MITFEPTKNLELVSVILQHPKIFSWVIDDASAKYPFALVPGMYVLIKDEHEILGVFSLHPFVSDTLQIHLAFLPKAWGKRTLAAAEQIAPWVFKHCPVHKIVGLIPDHNILTLALARRCKWRQEGTITNSFLKNGKYHDLIIMSIEEQ